MSILTVHSYLDRNALANARIQGIDEDIGLKGDQFNTAISVLFAGYIALQIPSNAVITRTRPSIYLVHSHPHYLGKTNNWKACLHDYLGSGLYMYRCGAKLHWSCPSSILSWIRRSVSTINREDFPKSN